MRTNATPDDKLTRAKSLMEQGLNVSEAAARLKIGKSALYEALAARGSSAPAGRTRLKDHVA